MSTLADSQSNAEDRTTRTKTEHAVLQARYHMLEDQLREVNVDTCNLDFRVISFQRIFVWRAEYEFGKRDRFNKKTCIFWEK